MTYSFQDEITSTRTHLAKAHAHMNEAHKVSKDLIELGAEALRKRECRKFGDHVEKWADVPEWIKIELRDQATAVLVACREQV